MVDAPTTRPVVTGFTQRTAQGLFSAPWLASPPDEGMATPLQLSDFLTQGPVQSDDPSRALGHLLAAQGQCRQAARVRDLRLCLDHYGQALQACERALEGLESCHGPTASALADWALGIHTLIRAQMAMTTDTAAARTLAYDALHQLSPIADPLCAGAQADALSAMLLVREPSELESMLMALPDEVRALVDEVEGEVHRKEAELNHALLAVRKSHRQGVAWSAGWGLLNLIFMATGPINSLYGSSIPWSLPFLIALPILWYVTWERPFRAGMPLFTYLRTQKVISLFDFREAAQSLPHPRERLCQELDDRLHHARGSQNRLAAFYLFKLPAEFDIGWKAQAVASGAKEWLCGDWIANLVDQQPWLLEEVLPTQPSLIPSITRVWYGSIR